MTHLYASIRYYLIAAEYFLSGESIIYYFKEIVMVDAFLLPFATHHRFISFTLYVIGKYDIILKANLFDFTRFRIVCDESQEGTLQTPDVTVRMDSYGHLFDRIPSTFYC
jgi:hypothetical protein